MREFFIVYACHIYTYAYTCVYMYTFRYIQHTYCQM